MRGFFLLALALCVAHVLAANVQVLTPDNFDNFVGKDQPVLVEFFAPYVFFFCLNFCSRIFFFFQFLFLFLSFSWCGHCKKLAPVYEELASNFKNEAVVIASVDANEHKDLGQRFEVTGFPTIKYFPAGSAEAEPYSGKMCFVWFGLVFSIARPPPPSFLLLSFDNG